jgi:hypothetical protein
MRTVRGPRIQIYAVLLIAFIAMGAQCVAFCEARDSVQPPCHQTDSSCSHDQAAGDNGVKGVKIVLAAIAAVVDSHPIYYEPSTAFISHLSPDPPIPDTVATTVLRI